jgi:16S rRNA (cytosine967-C5)-methyltransferase
VSAPAPARLAAWRALVRLRAGRAKLDDSRASLPELDVLEERDRRLATELVTGTVKRRLSVDAVLSSFSAVPLARVEADVHEALRLSAFQLLFLDRVPAHAAVDDGVALVAARGRRTRGFVNAVLRALSREGRERLAEAGAGDDLRSRAIRWSCPEWMVARLAADLGREAADALLAASNEAPERCLRVNTLRGDLGTARDALSEAGIHGGGVNGLPEALVYEGSPLETSAPFALGLVTPQSRGSQLAGLVAAGGGAQAGNLLDLCAAPGTKTSQLAAGHPQAHVVAVENDGRRAAALSANLERLGASAVEVLEADATSLPDAFEGAFDAVLVDAPCSGLGTLASRADLRWRRREADVARLAGDQRRLLAAGARCTRAGGSLTYAVCTVTAAETDAVVGDLVATGEWSLDDLGAEYPGAAHPVNGAYLLALPPAWGSTGFFIARLRREPRQRDAAR